MNNHVRKCIRAVWSKSSIATWRNFAAFAIQNAHSEDSNQTVLLREGCASWLWHFLCVFIYIFTLLVITLRKHAYSNILKILLPKNENYQKQNLIFSIFSYSCWKHRLWVLVRTKKVREKSRKCHNHKPQPFPDTKRKRKQTKPNKRKPNKRTKSTKISYLFPKRGNRNAKRTENTRSK